MKYVLCHCPTKAVGSFSLETWGRKRPSWVLRCGSLLLACRLKSWFLPFFLECFLPGLLEGLLDQELFRAMQTCLYSEVGCRTLDVSADLHKVEQTWVVCLLRPLLNLAMFTPGSVGILNHQGKCGQTQLAHVPLFQKCLQFAPFTSDSGISLQSKPESVHTWYCPQALFLLLESADWGWQEEKLVKCWMYQSCLSRSIYTLVSVPVWADQSTFVLWLVL